MTVTCLVNNADIAQKIKLQKKKKESNPYTISEHKRSKVHFGYYRQTKVLHCPPSPSTAKEKRILKKRQNRAAAQASTSTSRGKCESFNGCCDYAITFARLYNMAGINVPMWTWLKVVITYKRVN